MVFYRLAQVNKSIGLPMINFLTSFLDHTGCRGQFIGDVSDIHLEEGRANARIAVMESEDKKLASVEFEDGVVRKRHPDALLVENIG